MSRNQELELLIRAGFKIVKLRSGSKVPANKNWQQSATNDLKRISAWGDCNYGLLTGTELPNGLRFVVLDVDNKIGQNGTASFERLKSDFNLPDSAFSISPNGGEHHYYLVPTMLPLTAISRLLGRLGYAGIDLLGEGLQVLESPSILPTGKYQWVRPPSCGIENLSPSLLAVLIANGRQTKSSRKKITNGLPTAQRESIASIAIARSEKNDESKIVETLIQRFPIVHSGQRNERQTKAVGHLFSKGYPTQLIRHVVSSWLQHFENEISTPLAEAVCHAASCIASTERKVIRGQFVLAPIHEKLIAEQTLEKSLVPLLNFSCHHLQEVKNGKGKRKETLTVQESNFLTVIFLFCQYQVKQTSNAEEIKLTDRQVREIWRLLFGKTIEPKQNERLKRKFFTRPDTGTKSRKAEKFEFLVMVSKGSLGKPSIYAPCKNLKTALQATLIPKDSRHGELI